MTVSHLAAIAISHAAAACLMTTLAGCAAGPEHISEESDSEGSSITQYVRAADELANALAAANEAKGQEPKTEGLSLHRCRTQGIRPSLAIDVYVVSDRSENASGVVVAKARGHRLATPAKLALEKYNYGYYANGDTYFSLGSTAIYLSVNDAEAYATLTIGTAEIPLVCSAAPRGWGPGEASRR